MSDDDMTRDEALAYLTRAESAGRVPCSRYGTDTESCAPVAVTLAFLIADLSGSAVTVDGLDHCMSLVVNDHDDVFAVIADHGEPSDRAVIRHEIYNAAIAAAEQNGREAGQNAAEWWCQETIGGRTTGDVTDTARRIRDGIDDNDPEILDTLPRADFSGQWADGLTVESVASEAGWNLDSDDDDDTRDGSRDSIADAYETGFSEAVEETISAACEAILSDDDGEADR